LGSGVGVLASAVGIPLLDIKSLLDSSLFLTDDPRACTVRDAWTSN
jgi:hypothetical protein